MKYEKTAEYSNAEFRRITGVKRATFDKMAEILRKSYAKKHRHRGRTPKLSIENLLLAALEYLREYRTYAHIAASYGTAESNLYRGIKWVEDTLIRDGCQRHLKMSFSAGQHTSVYSLNYQPTCRLEARQVLIYQCILYLTGENDKYNYSKAVHFYPSFSYILCSAKNYKIALALTVGTLVPNQESWRCFTQGV